MEMKMITHGSIWAAIDGIAARYKLSPSGLARAAGLDATAFNKSKRFTASGRERWPSTESIAKVLKATGADFDEFVNLLISAHPQGAFGRAIPLMDMDAAAGERCFDEEGVPIKTEWDEISFSELSEDHLFALEVVEDEYEPIYWAGDVLIANPFAEVRRGDRVVVKLDDQVIVRHFVRRTLKRVELAPLHDFELAEVFDLFRMEWISRIVLVRQ